MSGIFDALVRPAMLIASISVFATTALADETEDRVARLQALYRCPIFSYLVEIRRAPVDDEQDRFLIVQITPDDSPYYVQCAFFDHERQLHCEAASPYYDGRLKGYVTRDKLATLARLGFSTEASKNNYFFERSASNLESLYEIAGSIVDVLGAVFDMQLQETLIYHTPALHSLSTATPAYAMCQPKISLR